MNPTSSDKHPVRNRLLQALPPEVYSRLSSRLTPVSLPLRRVLHAPDEIIHAVFFPESGYVSMTAPVDEGTSVEVGMIGREGMVGMSIVLGVDSSGLESMVQSPGIALRMEAEPFREALRCLPALREHLTRYTLVHHEQVARTAACNGRHSVRQRLGRWLLMAHDRSEADNFPMTHEFLSLMLGVRRAGVSVAAQEFQKAG